MKCVLYFSATERLVYRRSGGRLELEARYAASDAGIEEFREYLRRQKSPLYYVVADLAGEDFHEDQIPFLRGSDRVAIVERRLAQRYRDSRVAAAFSLGYVSAERRNERLLLASFANTQQFEPWLDALAEAGARLAGLYSVPLIAPALAAALGVHRGPCILVTVNRAGLRQCFVEDGKLRFARLERLPDASPAALAGLVRSETARLAQYLATLRVLPREGPPVQVLAVAPPGQRAVFEQALVSDAQLAFRAVDAGAAAVAAGTRLAQTESSAERLFLELAIKKPPAEQFARSEDRQGYFIWQLQRAIVALGVAGFAICAAYAGSQWLEAREARAQAEMRQRDTRLAAERYQGITASFPVTQTSTENLRAAVTQFRSIASRSVAPESSFALVSGVLERFPQFELDGLAWSVGRPEAPAAAARANTENPAAAADEIFESLQVSGRVTGTRRSDYRAITAQVRRFAEALETMPGYRLVRTQLPFDVTPEGTLTGDIGTAESDEAPRFTIVVTRKLQ
jgi:hypothetical protein